MSLHVASWAFRQQVGDPTTKLVLIKLALQCNDDFWCWPSRRTIASECEISLRVASRHTAKLAQLGLLEIVERRRTNGSQQSNIYRLNPRDASVHPPAQEWQELLDTDDITSLSPASNLESSDESSVEPLRSANADVVWDGLVEIFGEPSNKNTRGKRNVAVKLIRESLFGLEDPGGEIRRRAARWSEIFHDASFTDTGFANQWDALVPPRPANGPDPVRVAEEKAREERLAEEALALPREEQAQRLRELMDEIKGVVKEVPK